MTKNFAIKNNGNAVVSAEGFAQATTLAENLFGEVPNGVATTISIEGENGRLLAAISNRRIMGSFHKQEWGGRKGNDAIYIGEEQFDATDAVLLMAHHELSTVKDHDESSDFIGRSHIDWSGPCYVDLVDEICAYFGVYNLCDVTPEALAYARNRVNPKPAAEETVTLNIRLNLRVSPGVSVSEFIENLDYSVISNTVGVTVRNTEIVASS